jgi:hypothetical protein
MSFFGRKRRAERSSPAEVYTGLRAQVLALTREQLGDAVPRDAPILALLMETGYPEAVATLVAVADGSSSLYFSNGGGIIGAGTHATVAEASKRWLEAAVESLTELIAITHAPLPGEGMTQFAAVTGEGLRGTVAPEEELGKSRHRQSPLFHGGQDVITQIRLVQPLDS